ncbi:hypothetical protein [uncultured Gimesia sp.]|uniref:hypothetical protein n=1 Tax=uncultured Gimesia sp. TaxID=1678688 RepID=UPI0030DCE420|tara:strand:- start:107860 stop:109596 length:1737 start_codon:yes stop_codon:yes gene_type:complete
MQKQLLLSVFCLTQACFLLGIQSSPAQASGQMAQRIPSDTCLYFTVPNVKTAIKQWTNRSVLQILEEPALSEFKEEITTSFEKASREIKKETGYPLSTILEVPSGEVSLAVFKTAEDRIGTVATMEYGEGESSEVLKKLLSLAADHLNKAGAVRSIKRVNGTIFKTYSFEATKSESDTVPLAREVAYFLKDNSLVISNDSKLLEAVLSDWEGRRSDSLADNNEFQYILKKCEQEDASAAMHWYLNPINAIQSTLKIYAQFEPIAGMAQGVLPSLGITNLKATGGSAYFFTKDYEFVSKTFTYVKLPGFGLIDVFHCPAISQQPPWWVSNQCVSYYSINWSIEDAYQAAESLHDGFRVSPGALAKAIDDYSKQDDSPKIHLKKDLLDHLTGRIQIITEHQDLESVEQFFGRYTLVLGLKNPDTFNKTILALSDRSESKIAIREFQGTTLYEYPDSFLPAAYCIIDNTFIASTNVKELEMIIRKDRQAGSLVDDPVFKKISKTFPTKTSIISYQRLDAPFLAFTKLLQDNKYSGEIDAGLLSQIQSLDGAIKYLPITAGYTVPDDRGFFSVRMIMNNSFD